MGEPDQQEGVLRQPTGARLKITRCFQFNRPEDKTPLLDIGAGVGVDLDSQVGWVGGWLREQQRPSSLS